ncbi:probable methyltransferase-like protein 24 [Mytilus trossulus]|uniref:probable methyltransferase-like protein 24 n=1 Tax=Mytilus trossulus TaxID=6551 RepID=UPI0030077C4B
MTDGGWNVCHDKPYRPPFPCLVYSFGINKDFSFDDFIVKTYGCDVHSFDPSIGKPDFRRGDQIWFHNLGLSSVTGKLRKWKVSTLKDIVDNLNHTSRNVNIVKMDIEFSEWTSLPNIIKTGTLRNTKQLLVEFHGSSASVEKLQTLRNIYNEGFRIYWYHRNPRQGNLLQGRFVQNSACYEVYFLRI